MKAKTNLPITVGSRTLQRFANIVGFAMLFVGMSQVAAAATPTLTSAGLAIAAVLTGSGGCCGQSALAVTGMNERSNSSMSLPRMLLSESYCQQIFPFVKKCYYPTQWCYVFSVGASRIPAACYPYSHEY